MNTKLSPLIIFAYNRIEPLKLTLEYLKKNTLANNTDLIIFSDGGKSSDDQILVDKVRNYLKSINHFKSYVLIERDENLGLAKNIINGVSEVIDSYEKVIVLEDDLITSSNFLCFMNESLKYYQNRGDIFSVSGYTADLPSLIRLKEDSYLSYRPSSWGWATWKDRWNNIDWDVQDYPEFIENKHQVALFNRGGIDMTRMLKKYKQGKNQSWAIRYAYSMFKQNKLCVYPKVSKIRNIGFGRDATNCNGVNIYDSNIDDQLLIKFDFNDEDIPNKKIAKEFRYQYSYKNKFLKRFQNIFNFGTR